MTRTNGHNEKQTRTIYFCHPEGRWFAVALLRRRNFWVGIAAFAHQAPNGVVNAAQHTFRPAQLFSLQAKEMLRAFFSP